MIFLASVNCSEQVRSNIRVPSQAVLLQARAGQANVEKGNRVTPFNFVKSTVLQPSVESIRNFWNSTFEAVIKLPDMLLNLKGAVLESPKSAAINLAKSCAALGILKATFDEGLRRSAYFWTNAFPVYLHYKCAASQFFVAATIFMSA